jgi:1,4-dihydroxy-2-naphthoyl-CoA synthase
MYTLFFPLALFFNFSVFLVKDAQQTIPLSSTDPARRALDLQQHILDFQHAISAPERCAVPVIVALHGTALGLAIDLALACDVRYASSDAELCIKVRGAMYDFFHRRNLLRCTIGG